MPNQTIFRSESIFPNLPSHPSVHASTITSLPDGDLLACFYAGTVEKAKDITIFQTRYQSRKGVWGDPEIAVEDPVYSLGNPVLFLAPDGVLWLYYLVMQGQKWFTCTLHSRKSLDFGKTWQYESEFDNSLGWTIRNNLIQLDNGEILFPLCDESKGYSFFMASSDFGVNWETRGKIISNPDNSQPAVIQRKDGSLLAYARPAGDGGCCWKSESQDKGYSWSPAKPGPFKNPNAAMAMVKLKSGNLVAVYNDSDRREYRTPLVVSLSENEGQSWPYKRALENEQGEFTYSTSRIDNWNSVEFSYPAITQSQDAMIHVTYTNDHRRNIKHAMMNEDWIKSSQEKE